jgi:hypothetical protein
MTILNSFDSKPNLPYNVNMGKLVDKNSLGLAPSWYFEDAYLDHYNDHWRYAWPNPSFPYSTGIHSDRFKNKIGIEIRKWVEESVPGTVIHEYMNKSYRRYYSKDHSWEHSYEQSNWWRVFYFEDEHSATVFRLKFAEYIQDVTDKHPTDCLEEET